jgi:hypothetical protein
MSTPKAKISWPLVILAGITLVLSSYGLFKLAHDFGHVPTPIALLAVGGFDLTAMAAGHQAMRVAKDGDSPAAWNALLVLAAGLSAVLQYAHTQLANQSWVIGVMFAFFPIATVVLFEGTLRRTHRLNGRRTGAVARPRASFELLQWLVFPRITLWAFRQGVMDRSLSAQALFTLAVVKLTPEEEETVSEEKRREIEMDYAETLRGRGQITSGLSGSNPDQTGESADSVRIVPDRRKLTELVAEALQVTGADDESVVAEVSAVRPDVKPESIRKAIRTVRTPRSA